MDEKQIRARIVQLENEIKELEGLLPPSYTDYGYAMRDYWGITNVMLTYDSEKSSIKITKRKRPKLRMIEDDLSPE